MTEKDNKSFTFDLDDRGVGLLTLNRPEIHNAFDDQLILELTNFFELANSQKDIQLIILTGAGKSFCAGADLNWMKRMVNYSEEENLNDSKKLAKMLHVMNNFKKPLVAKVNGAVMGGGVGLVSVCDHAIASDRALFALSEVKLGILPAVISPYVISKIGESYARSTFLSGMRFRSDKALKMGLIHESVSAEQLDESVEKYVTELLSSGPEARELAKTLVKKIIEYGSDESGKEEYSCRLICQVRVSKEGQEGMGALLEKRKPNWVNK